MSLLCKNRPLWEFTKSVNLPPSTPLQDLHGRRFSYLRLSITDACNFRCVYCLPHGYERAEHAPEPLSVPEIRNLVAAFTELGMWKVRLTGGEPTLRRDLLEIIDTVAANPAVRRIGLSTNGYRLRSLARDLRSAGVAAVNVSVDTLDPDRFRAATGSDALPEILGGIDEALALGFDSVKVNAVLMKDVNDQDLALFLDWIRARPVAVRFIELMPTGRNSELFQSRHLSSATLHAELEAQGWRARERGPADGPALELEHPSYRGRIGIIAPYSKDFCASCNRLRVSSTGGLRLCLFAEGDSSLRPWLRAAEQKDELKDRIRALLNQKEVSHYLPEGRYGNNQTFSAIGG